MKVFILCVFVAVFAVVQPAPANNPDVMELLKRIGRLLDEKAAEKRYHYSKPMTANNRPGEVWVDLQSVVEVEKDCPDCRLYVAAQCTSAKCHNHKVNYIPQHGYTWQLFKKIFIDGNKGDWLSGLENGMDYKIWDAVKTANGEIYPGYKNNDRYDVTIPA